MKAKYVRIHDALAIALITVGLLWVIALQLPVHAQQSATAVATGTLQLQNGKLEPRPVVGLLGDIVNRWAESSTKAEWLGYSVAEVNGDRSVCCENWKGNNSLACGTCRLEGQNYSTNISSNDRDSAKVNLEGPRELAVLYRAESGKISQIRMFSIECAVDAGGLKLIWLQGVKSSDSVGLLEKFVHGADLESDTHEKVGQSALTAIALHADPVATRAMESFVATPEPASLRRETAFWLGEARGADGLRILQKMAQNDPSPDVRAQVTFALSVSKEPGALPEMIRMAHNDKSAQVRGQALFWLGQKAGEKAAKAITGSIDNDPDTEVKKKAVFALSQMPSDQGVPKLIQVAETNRNPHIRKEAMFWLGQSEDPQALAFFEKVLSQ
jgi:hypothetical protein